MTPEPQSFPVDKQLNVSANADRVDRRPVVAAVAPAMLIPAEVEAGAAVYTATMRFTVPYRKWGMKNPSVLLLRVSDKVEIVVHAVGRGGT